MGDQSNSTYSNILLENMDSDIPIVLNFTTPPKVTQAQDNQVANELSTKKSSSIISDTERYVTTNLKEELLCEMQHHFSSLQCSRDSCMGEYIATLKEQIDFLKNEVFFREKISAKKMN